MWLPINCQYSLHYIIRFYRLTLFNHHTFRLLTFRQLNLHYNFVIYQTFLHEQMKQLSLSSQYVAQKTLQPGATQAYCTHCSKLWDTSSITQLVWFCAPSWLTYNTGTAMNWERCSIFNIPFLCLHPWNYAKHESRSSSALYLISLSCIQLHVFSMVRMCFILSYPFILKAKTQPSNQRGETLFDWLVIPTQLLLGSSKDQNCFC